MSPHALRQGMKPGNVYPLERPLADRLIELLPELEMHVVRPKQVPAR